eukprot:2281111-Karenia_brevis.AAC.1
MLEMTTTALHKFKLRWKSEQMVYIAGTNVENPKNFTFEAADAQSFVVHAVEELEALGVLLDRRGSTKA